MPFLPAAEIQHIRRCAAGRAWREWQTNVNLELMKYFVSQQISHICIREGSLCRSPVAQGLVDAVRISTDDRSRAKNTQRMPLLTCICHSYESKSISIERPMKGLERCYKDLEIKWNIFPFPINNYFPVFGNISYREFMLRPWGEEYTSSDNIKLQRWF